MTSAIEELEKAKKWCEEQNFVSDPQCWPDRKECPYCETIEKVLIYLDDQINKLKKEQG